MYILKSNPVVDPLIPLFVSLPDTIQNVYVLFALSRYVLVLISWSYFRVFVFYGSIIEPAFALNKGKGLNEYVAGGTMLFSLCLMHIYWIILFLKMGYDLANSGEAIDQQEEGSKKER